MVDQVLESLSREEKGSYVLLMKLSQDTDITAGSLGSRTYRSGWYAYVGSAMGGLKARLSRHLRREKKMHWHIDYLLTECPINVIIIVGNRQRVECAIADVLAGSFKVIPGFGSSDCGCAGHLFFSDTVMDSVVPDVLAGEGFGIEMIDCREGR